MKFTILSKTACIIGFMVALCVVVAPSIASSVQAQLQPPAQPQSAQPQPSAEEIAQRKRDREGIAQQDRERVERSWVRAVPDFCPKLNDFYATGDTSDFPPLFFDEEGNFRSWDLFGIDLTPEQSAVYDQAERKLSERAAALDLELKREVIPNSLINAGLKEGFSMTDTIATELYAAIDAINQDQTPNEEQIDALVEKYGQYADIEMATIPLYTPEQILERQSIELEFSATMTTAFTNPEQREYYLRNVDAGNAIESCSPDTLLTK